jgi:5-methyltetrahydrofolate--homocysteine methyltransferase
MKDFIVTIRQRPIVGDGPMGITLFSRLGQKYGTSEEFNLHDPKAVLHLHREYLDAGCEVVGANTFSANRVKLARGKALDRLEEMNRLGIELAREASNGKAWVAGKLGPTGRLLEPLGDMTASEARDAYVEQASIIVDAGVDFIVIETMSDLGEAKLAYEAVRSVSEMPIAVSFTFDANLRTMMGVTPDQAVQAASSWGADLLGTNCGVGPEPVEQAVERMLDTVPDALLWVAPNAGLPRLENGRTVYGVTPARFADYAERVARAGAKVISGCCGSTPDHLRAVVERLAKLRRLNAN